VTPWCAGSIGPDVIAEAVSVYERWKFNWWDCLIVASAKAAHCRYLLTEDLRDRQRLDEMTVLNPFHTPPVSVVGQG
jgi:predicted nucleic acid-binding protein